MEFWCSKDFRDVSKTKERQLLRPTRSNGKFFHSRKFELKALFEN